MSKILDRIRKLMATAKGNANVEEAASAGAIAAELMFKHQIGEADLDMGEPEGPEEVVDESIFADDGRLSTWKARLGGAVARGFGATLYTDQRQGGTRYQVVGLKSTVQTVSYMFGLLVLEVERLANEGFEEAKAAGEKAHGKTWKNSFRIGAGITIGERLDAQRKKQIKYVDLQLAYSHTTTPGLVLFKTDQQRQEVFYDDLKKRLKMKTVKTQNSWSMNGFEAGKRAGESVSLGGGRELPAPKPRIQS